MYIVRDKSTKQIVYVNPAPLDQNLEGTGVYARFDPATMEIGRSDLREVPEHFDIDPRGVVVPRSRYRQGEPRHETAGGAGPRHADRRLKLVGKQLVPKTNAELVQEGLITLAGNEKLDGDHIVSLSPRVAFDEKRYTFQQYKDHVIDQHDRACLEARRKVLQDHELLYAAIGAVGPERVEECRTIVASFVQALDKAKVAIRKAKTADEVEDVPMRYEQGSAPAPPPRKPGRREPR